MEVILGLALWALVVWLLRKKYGAKSTPAVRWSPLPTWEPEASTKRIPKPSPSPPPIPQWRWIPQGTAVSVAGLTVPDGMIYVGKGLRSVSGVEVEPALIIPGLPVNSSNPDLEGVGVPYWPSYSEISSRARAGYLLWLAQGRRRPGAYIGYVFLFLYGLERRVFGDQARQDIPRIAGEVRALLDIYKTSRSFASYATRFLDACAALSDLSNLDTLCSTVPCGELPFLLKLQLARLSLARRSIPAELALTWLDGVSSFSGRAVVERCAAEFRELFGMRYRERFGDGMVIEPNKTRLSFSYRPASRSFHEGVDIDVGDLPDVTALQKPITDLSKLAESCIEELEPYSRWLGRNPDARGCLEAVALLPSAMAMSHAGVETRAFANWLDTAVSRGEPMLLKRPELMERWPNKLTEDSPERKTWLEISKVLQMLGYGIEPDVRFQGLIGGRTAHVVLFKLGEARVETASPEYLQAALMARFGMVIAAADGDISEVEMTRLAEMLQKKLDLSPAERLRLAAHLKLLAAEGASLAGAKKKLEGLSQEQRTAIAHVATLVALADGRVTKEESANLGKIYSVLGLDPKRVYEDLHALGVDDRAPDPDVVTVKPATGDRKGYAIPKPEDPHRVVLDKVRLEMKAKETREVAEILKSVFVEEQPPAPPPPPVVADAVAGLDQPHSFLLRQLTDKSTVQRADWESWCSRFGVLPDGAIDRINEAAWDICGGPLLDGEDTISVEQAALKEMLA